MRLGILGGTFDPVHYGHLVLAEQCREQRRLDRVWFMPSGGPPHKQSRPITPARRRVEMLQLAIAGHEAFEVSSRELERPGPIYTVETLTALKTEQPAWELFFLIGSDSLADLPTWRAPRRIADLATLVVAVRAGGPLIDLEPLAQALTDEQIARIRAHVVEMPAIGISSTDLRHRARDGRSLRYLTPRAVECYIATQNLYKADP